MRRLTTLSLSVCAIVAAAATTPSHAEIARGIVYADLDADRARDPGESGVPEVAVSNGREVVLTDGEGRYEIDLVDGDVLFVTKPSGYFIPLRSDGVPEFYYVYRPHGTPAELELRYPGVEATGPLPVSIDFPLWPRDEDDSFDVILFADPQPESHAELDYVRDDVVTEYLDSGVAFGMTLGDILYDDLSLFPRMLELIGTMGVPWLHVPGNHDMNLLAPSDELSLETYKRYLGPPSYSFNYARAHFVVLDDVIYEGTSPSGDGRGKGSYHGGFTGDQLDWLEADLALVPADHLVVITVHIPLRTDLESDPRGAALVGRDRLLKILGRREHVISFAGHTHTVEHNYLSTEDGWPGATPLHEHVLATVSGSWWTGPRDERGIPVTLQRDGVPNGATILSIDGNRATTRFRAANQPIDRQMSIGFNRAFHQIDGHLYQDYRPFELEVGPLLADEVPSTELFVNLYNGGPRSSVEMRIDEGAWIKLDRRLRKDPFAIEMMTRHEDTMKGWVKPVATGHLWFVGLPEQLDAGIHEIEVRATDESMVQHRGYRLFEVRR